MIKKSKFRHGSLAAVVFGMSAVASFIALVPEESFASKDLRMPCMTGRIDSSGVSEFTYECLFPDSSDFRAGSITTLNMHWADVGSGARAANYLSAKACVSYWDSVGGT